jgi:hypothetical protein
MFPPLRGDCRRLPKPHRQLLPIKMIRFLRRADANQHHLLHRT